MGKEQKYSEEKLLEAVVKYAGLHKRKIKTTELAAWASMNIDGLEGVKDYHFTRDVTETDPKTGEKTTRPKECKKRINEINRSRHTASEIHNNPLLQASNVDAFLELPPHDQRYWILETRKQVGRLVAENRKLQNKENTENIEASGKNSEKIIFKKKVKVFLNKGYEAFSDAMEYLKNSNLLDGLFIFNNGGGFKEFTYESVNSVPDVAEMVKSRLLTSYDIYANNIDYFFKNSKYKAEIEHMIENIQKDKYEELSQYGLTEDVINDRCLLQISNMK